MNPNDYSKITGYVYWINLKDDKKLYKENIDLFYNSNYNYYRVSPKKCPLKNPTKGWVVKSHDFNKIDVEIDKCPRLIILQEDDDLARSIMLEHLNDLLMNNMNKINNISDAINLTVVGGIIKS